MTERETSTATAIAHQANFLKEIVAIMMGLSLTNALYGFVGGEWPQGFEQPSRLEETFVFGLLLLNIVRFFCGTGKEEQAGNAEVPPGSACSAYGMTALRGERNT